MPLSGSTGDIPGSKFFPQGSGARNKAKTNAEIEAALTAERLKRWAHYLDQQRLIYATYGALDGLNIAYSTVKYFFDVLVVDTNLNSSDEMHFWTITPEGIAVAALETVCLVAFSMLANYFKEDSYELAWSPGDTDDYEAKKLYLTLHEADDELNQAGIDYAVLDSQGTLCRGVIAFSALDKEFDISTPVTLARLRHYLPQILAITTANKHTKAPNLFKNYLTVIWPYFRDAFKGLKNSYKGFRSLTAMLSLLGVNSLHHLNLLIVPFSLALGVLSMGNRIWYRKMKNGRKTAQDENKVIRKELLAKATMTEEEASAFRASIRRYQPQALRRKALASACYGGLIDGLYLYMGVFALAPLMGPLFFAVCAVSLLYVVLSVTSRLYEEYDYQNKLKASELELELLLSIKLLRTQLQDLHHLLERQKMEADDPDEQKLLNQQIKTLLEQKSIATLRAKLLMQRQALDTLLTLDNNLAFWAGLRSGLTAYGVVASMLFALGTILFLASVAFPPALLFAGIALGVVCLAAFTVHSLVVNYHHRQEKLGLGLFSMETDPLKCSKESLKDQLQGRDGLVLYQEQLYYVDHSKNTVKPLRETSKNAAAINVLKSKFVPWYSLADEEVLQQFKLLTGITRGKVENPFSEMDELSYSLKNAEKIVNQRQEKESIVDALERKGLAVDASPQYFFQEWFEIFRAWFSGVAKGSKSVDFMLNPLQAIGKDGHYHAIPVMIWITIGSAIIYSVGFALRALARGFGGTSHIPKGSPVDEPSFTPSPASVESLSPPPRTPCTSPIPSEGGIDGVVTENSSGAELSIDVAMDAAEGVTSSGLPEKGASGLVTNMLPTTALVTDIQLTVKADTMVDANGQEASNAVRVEQDASLANSASALTLGGLSIFATPSPVRSRAVSPVRDILSPEPTPSALLTPSASPTC